MPPSIVAIIYAVTAGVSIAGLFAASVVPALIVVVALCIAVWVYGIRAGRTGQQLMAARSYSLREKGTLALKTLPALLTPVILLGGVFGGIFTPTEAAAIAALYILIIGLFYRSFSFRKLTKVLYADFGVDPFQLGVVVIMNLVLGLLTPPIGILLYVLADVTKSSFGSVLRGVLPFLGLLLLLLLLFTFVPAVATALPSIMGFG